jgi:transcriptional repressor NrdR
MICPFCNYFETKVVDSRPTDEGSSIRRRRECNNCNKRFTTYEKIEEVPILVVKRDKTREPLNRGKIISGILKSCEKRPVSMADIEKIVIDIEKQLSNSMEQEVTSLKIGELVANKLKDLDEVAYVRFASVYRRFTDIGTFKKEVDKILAEK